MNNLKRPSGSEFAPLWALDPDGIYLNHGSFGACPTYIVEKRAEYLREMERQPMVFLIRKLEEMLYRSRQKAAEFVGVKTEDLVFVPNATAAVNIVFRSLKFNPGDEILFTNHIYGGCRRVLEYISEETGAILVEAVYDLNLSSPNVITEAVLSKETSRTKIALIDHITSATALLQPVDDIVRELEKRGVDTLVDGAHAMGSIPLDLEALGAAWYTANCHKWLCGPKTAAILHVRRDKQKDIVPAVISHAGAKAEVFADRFFWPGTSDPTPVITVPDTIDYMASLMPGGWPAIMKRNHELAIEGRNILCETLGIQKPCPDEMIVSMATLELPTPGNPVMIDFKSLEPMENQLFREYNLEGVLWYWGTPPRFFTRISAALYNSPDQFRYYAEILKGIQNNLI
jgi:isopenicillin-N epimerase